MTNWFLSEGSVQLFSFLIPAFQKKNERIQIWPVDQGGFFPHESRIYSGWYIWYVNISIKRKNPMHLPALNQILEPVVIQRQDFCTFSSSVINPHWLCIRLMNISLWRIPSFLLRHYLSQVHLFQLSTTEIRVISHVLNTQGVNQAFILNSGPQAIWMSMFIPAVCDLGRKIPFLDCMHSYVHCNVTLLRHC